MLKPFITFSGADEKTHIDSLGDLSVSGAEIGFLYSATPEGRNRYPSRAWIKKACLSVSRASLHICGKIARHELLCEKLDDLVPNVNRIQINGKVSPEELEYLRVCYPDKSLIIQGNISNNETIKHIANMKNVAVLMDASGGRGVSPAEWLYPDFGKNVKRAVGFAGGLGKDNLASELEKIKVVAKGAWWVDMETKLRNKDDRFDIGIARECLNIFQSNI